MKSLFLWHSDKLINGNWMAFVIEIFSYRSREQGRGCWYLCLPWQGSHSGLSESVRRPPHAVRGGGTIAESLHYSHSKPMRHSRCLAGNKGTEAKGNRAPHDHTESFIIKEEGTEKSHIQQAGSLKKAAKTGVSTDDAGMERGSKLFLLSVWTPTMR